MFNRKVTLKCFYAIFIIFNFILLSCSKNDNPTSPSNNNAQIEIEKISISVTVEDTIPTAFLNNFAKLCNNNECGLIEVNINNNNNQPIQLKLSVKIENYTNEITEMVTIAANDSELVNTTPVLSTEELNKFNENKTVQISVKASQIQENTNTEIFAQTYTRQMLAKDVMLLNTEYLPLLVTWVTPHVSEIDKLISSAKKYHPESEFVGYQGSDTEDGYKKEQKGPFRYSIDVSTGQQEIVPLGYIDIDYMKGCVISGSFSAEGGFLGHEIIVQLLLEDEEILYDSGKVQQDSFSEIINKSGNYYLEFDNSFSFLTPKTVTYTLTISYNYDLVNAQVKAIYLALQNDYNIDYVNSTISYPDGITQRIRLPQDALELGSANCIDGAVLFASALENIGLEPLIVLVPGHAFVGWRRWTESNVADFLETTMIGNSSFADACNEGNYKFTTNKDKSDTDIIDVKYYRGTYNLTPLMKQIAIK